MSTSVISIRHDNSLSYWMLCICTGKSEVLDFKFSTNAISGIQQFILDRTPSTENMLSNDTECEKSYDEMGARPKDKSTRSTRPIYISNNLYIFCWTSFNYLLYFGCKTYGICQSLNKIFFSIYKTYNMSVGCKFHHVVFYRLNWVAGKNGWNDSMILWGIWKMN
jgi:hypothetical protein